MKPTVAIQLSELENLTTYHYKVILYLEGSGEATQTKMSEKLGTSKQRINTVCKELQSIDIIKVKRKEGRNIFWELNPKPTFQTKGQLKMDI